MAGEGLPAIPAAVAAKPPVPSYHRLQHLSSGAVAGLLVTAVLNPWDRALYLSVVNHRPFLHPANWQTPYQGVLQSVSQRGLQSGLYFPLEEVCAQALGSHAAGGQLAGLINGALLNPIALVKHQNWGSADGGNFASMARHLYRTAGPLVFCRGMISTMLRDATFGLFFSLRKNIEAESEDRSFKFVVTALCAGVGTIVSSPFNYHRSVTYHACVTKELETIRSSRTFLRETFREFYDGARSQGSLLNSLKFVQDRLKLGWGTARVAVGMALCDTLYTTFSKVDPVEPRAASRRS